MQDDAGVVPHCQRAARKPLTRRGSSYTSPSVGSRVVFSYVCRVNGAHTRQKVIACSEAPSYRPETGHGGPLRTPEPEGMNTSWPAIPDLQKSSPEHTTDKSGSTSRRSVACWVPLVIKQPMIAASES